MLETLWARLFDVQGRNSTEEVMSIGSADLVAQSRAYLGEAIALASQSLRAASIQSDDHVGVLLLTKAFRSAQYARAILRVSDTEAIGPVASLLRTQLELRFIAEAVCADPAKLSLLQQNDAYERRRSIQNLRSLDLTERVDGLTDQYLDRKLAADPRGSRTTMLDWASHAGHRAEYLTAYAYLSRFTHASLSAASDHVMVRDGVAVEISSGYDPESMAHLVVDSGRSLLMTVMCVAKRFEDEHAAKGLFAAWSDERADRIARAALSKVDREVGAIIGGRS